MRLALSRSAGQYQSLSCLSCIRPRRARERKPRLPARLRRADHNRVSTRMRMLRKKHLRHRSRPQEFLHIKKEDTWTYDSLSERRRVHPSYSRILSVRTGRRIRLLSPDHGSRRGIRPNSGSGERHRSWTGLFPQAAYGFQERDSGLSGPCSSFYRAGVRSQRPDRYLHRQICSDSVR